LECLLNRCRLLINRHLHLSGRHQVLFGDAVDRFEVVGGVV
jgi:hypothetical protein